MDNRKKTFITILLIGAIISCVLNFYHNKSIEEYMNKELEHHALIIQNHIESSFSHEMFILSVMSSNWERTGGVEKDVWFEQASKVVEHYNFQAVSWVDGAHVRWIIPLKGNEKAVDLDLRFEESRRVAILRSIETKKVSIGGPMDLVQGGTGLLLFAPIFDGDKHVGFINGVIRTQDKFDKIITEIDSHHDDYYVKIESNNKTLYSKGDSLNLNLFSKKSTIEGLEYNLTIAIERPSSPNVIIIGLLMSLFLATAFYIILSIREREYP
jgi:sensor domain CHASE-containing protein